VTVLPRTGAKWADEGDIVPMPQNIDGLIEIGLESSPASAYRGPQDEAFRVFVDRDIFEAVEGRVGEGRETGDEAEISKRRGPPSRLVDVEALGASVAEHVLNERICRSTGDEGGVEERIRGVYKYSIAQRHPTIWVVEFGVAHL